MSSSGSRETRFSTSRYVVFAALAAGFFAFLMLTATRPANQSPAEVADCMERVVEATLEGDAIQADRLEAEAACTREESALTSRPLLGGLLFAVAVGILGQLYVAKRGNTGDRTS